MSSHTPHSTNLWVERSRLVGMVLGSVLYGAFLVLTIQSLAALTLRPRHGGKFTNYRVALIFYIVITFVLGTICTAANMKYTEMIWIDLRDSPGGPLALIDNPCKYRINVISLCCGHIQEWFMQALLLHRCFVIWNWARYVTIPMIAVYITMIGLSIMVQVEISTSTLFYHVNTQLAYLCVEVGLTVIYAILVAYRFLAMRNQLKQIIANYDSCTYANVVRMIVESVMAYTILAIIFIISYALDNDALSALCFISIGKVQGIAQLLIILRVARGQSVTNEWSTQDAVPTTVVYWT